MINKPIIKNVLVIIIALLVANILSSFFLGIFMVIGGNIQLVGLNKLNFDPLITIAYMILYYFLDKFFQPMPNAQLFLFIFALFLSFSVNFLQGSIFLVIFYFTLKKLKII